MGSFWPIASQYKEGKTMPGEKFSFEKKCQTWGWVLFIASALFFIAASIRAKDVVGFCGALLFLVACFVFLIPFVFSGPSKKNRRKNSPS
jgi:hypothetical protein